MIETTGAELHEISATLRQLGKGVEAKKRGESDDRAGELAGVRPIGGFARSLSHDLRALMHRMGRVGASVSAQATLDLTFKLAVPPSWDTVVSDFEDIERTLGREFKIPTVLILNRDEASLFKPPFPLFGQTVADKFPGVTYEIDEAAKCLALGRATASVFHSIRCLEAAIEALSRCLGIPDPTKAADRSWFKLLAAMKAEIDRRWPPSQLPGDDARFFGEAHAALAAMQNPWRNATMHLEQKYTPDEARHILGMVEGFMKKLASRMDENGEPKLP
jgi:hypothetical protein